MPYRVGGRAIDLRTQSLVDWSGVVFGDGYGPDTPGPNVDPNILADVLPWHLSFCRIGDRKKKSLVGAVPPLRAPAVLGEVAVVGDLIVFGDALSPHIMFIDSVLCVGSLPEIPQRSGSFVLQKQFARYWAATGGRPSMSWAAFERSRVFRWNLHDSMPGRRHETTGVCPHHQIVGRRAVPPRLDRDSIRVALENGSGFNFIPLAAERVSRNREVLARPGLFTARVNGVGKLVRSTKNRVWRLPVAMATNVLDSIARNADVLVLDPLEPVSPELN